MNKSIVPRRIVLKLFIVSGDIRPAMPITRRMFVMLLPIRFPKSIVEKPFLAAAMLVVNSGRVVPIEIIARAIMLLGIWKRVAIFTAELTRYFEP